MGIRKCVAVPLWRSTAMALTPHRGSGNHPRSPRSTSPRRRPATRTARAFLRPMASPPLRHLRPDQRPLVRRDGYGPQRGFLGSSAPFACDRPRRRPRRPNTAVEFAVATVLLTSLPTVAPASAEFAFTVPADLSVDTSYAITLTQINGAHEHVSGGLGRDTYAGGQPFVRQDFAFTTYMIRRGVQHQAKGGRSGYRRSLAIPQDGSAITRVSEPGRWAIDHPVATRVRPLPPTSGARHLLRRPGRICVNR